jgi:hypothetical protein
MTTRWTIDRWPAVCDSLERQYGPVSDSYLLVIMKDGKVYKNTLQ